MRTFAIAAVVGFLSWAAPSNAASLVGERVGWQVYRDDGSRFLTMKFERPGDTERTLVKVADDTFGVSVTNMDRSATERAEYDIANVLADVEFSGVRANGIAEGARKGFISFFEPSFERHFAASSSLHVYLGDQRIDRISLSGKAAGLALVNQAPRRVFDTSGGVEREQARWTDLPKDPFATVEGAVPSAAQPPIPRGNPGSWATINDYPSVSRREKHVGPVIFRVIVGIDGRVSECEISKSSGHADIDAATCENVRRRARFKPATDGAGNPIIGEYSDTIRWLFPRDY